MVEFGVRQGRSSEAGSVETGEADDELAGFDALDGLGDGIAE